MKNSASVHSFLRIFDKSLIPQSPQSNRPFFSPKKAISNRFKWHLNTMVRKQSKNKYEVSNFSYYRNISP